MNDPILKELQEIKNLLAEIQREQMQQKTEMLEINKTTLGFYGLLEQFLHELDEELKAEGNS